jgi:2-amino-4-hydroxy-6-hydroxymethyldihydropteridine diphosphokinase
MIRLYILLGGNLGDKQKVFSETRNKLKKQVGKITAQSSVYETEPWRFESKDLFWNQVVEISTKLSPEEVLSRTQQIELELGRIRKANQYDSRIIDIDILFYGNQIIEQENLIIPHPRIQERKFALMPLSEIAPELMHPVFQKSIGQLLQECSDELKVEKVSDFPETHNS